MKIPIKFFDLISPHFGKDVLHLHIPKCGGTAIKEAFGKRSDLCPSLKWKDASGHLTIFEYARVFKNHSVNLDDFFTFTIVRNPWDWHVSWYNYLRKDVDGKLSGLKFEAQLLKKVSFLDYIDWIDNYAEKQVNNSYLTKQLSDWIINDKGKIGVDCILHQENLENELNQMLEKMNSKIKINLPRVNYSRSKDQNYRDYYNDKAIKIIESRHRKDIELFGYNF